MIIKIIDFLKSHGYVLGLEKNQENNKPFDYIRGKMSAY